MREKKPRPLTNEAPELVELLTAADLLIVSEHCWLFSI